MTNSTETRRLLGLAQRGDQAAFQRLFDRTRDRLRRLVDLRLDKKMKRRIDASDIVQETQLECTRRLDDYLARVPMPFDLWVRKTAYQKLQNLRRDHVHAAKRSIDREQPLPDQSSLLIAQSVLEKSDSPSQVASRREFHDTVLLAINELPATDREILLMRNVEGLTHPEIACLLDIEPATARKRYGRALLRLRAALENTGIADTGT